MKIKSIVGVALAFGLFAAIASSCSTQSNNFFHNLTAAQCDNQQATLAQLPGVPFLSNAQEALVLAGACAALYGTSPAPATAPGNSPVFPASSPTGSVPPPPSASPVASPAAGISK